MQQSKLAHSESARQPIPSTPLLPSAYEHHISKKIRGLNKHFSSLTMSRPSSPTTTTTTTTTDTTPTPAPAPVPTGGARARAKPPLCHHGVAPPDCEPCTLHQHTKASKRAWTIAKEVYGPLHWRTSAARRDHTRARVAEQSCLDGYFRAQQQQQQQQNVSMSSNTTEASSSSAATTLDVLPDSNNDGDFNSSGKSARTTITTGKTVSFAPDVDDSPGRSHRAFLRRADEYVPGRYAGDWEDTSGHHVPFSVFYSDNAAMQMAITFFKKW